MINLLPLEVSENYRYARRNQRALPWVIALIAALVLLAVISVYGIITLNQTANNYQQQVTSSQHALSSAHVSKVTSNIEDISSSLRLVTEVLGREILFSKLLTQISTVVPSGVNLTGLNINQDDTAIDLNAEASNYSAATQLQANLTDPSNQIFSKADLVSVNCAKTTSANTNPLFPCAVEIRAEFNPSNQFLFINDKGGTIK